MTKLSIQPRGLRTGKFIAAPRLETNAYVAALRNDANKAAVPARDVG
jgi:hypothetical protein